MKIKILVTLFLLIARFPYNIYAGANEDLIKAIRANNADGVKSAIAAGADINKQDENGNLPLAGAAWWADITRILIDAKADVNLKSKSGLTPLMSAAILGETDVVNLLLAAKADIKAANISGQQALYLACFNGSQASTLKSLLAAGSDVNLKDNLGQSPLFGLSAYGKTPSERVMAIKSMVPYLEKANLTLPERFKNPKESDYSSVEEMMKVLIDAGADVNADAKAGFTPLMWAAKSGKAEAVKMLLAAKADVNKTDIAHHSALASAAMAKNGNGEIVKMLAAAGADINGETWEYDKEANGYSKGFTPISIAAMNNNLDVVKVLIGLGAKVDEEITGWGQTNPLFGTPCRYTVKGKTAIWFAVENNNLDMVKALVQAKSNIKKPITVKYEKGCSANFDWTSLYGLAKSMKEDAIKDYLKEQK